MQYVIFSMLFISLNQAFFKGGSNFLNLDNNFLSITKIQNSQNNQLYNILNEKEIKIISATENEIKENFKNKNFIISQEIAEDPRLTNMQQHNINGINVRSYDNFFYIGLNENFQYFENLHNISTDDEFLKQIKIEKKNSNANFDKICNAATLDLDIVDYCDFYNKLKRGFILHLESLVNKGKNFAFEFIIKKKEEEISEKDLDDLFNVLKELGFPNVVKNVEDLKNLENNDIKEFIMNNVTIQQITGLVEKLPGNRIPQGMLEMLTIYKIENLEPENGEMKVMEIKINTYGLIKLIYQKYQRFKTKFFKTDEYGKLIFDNLDNFFLTLIKENQDDKDYYIVFAFDKGEKYLKESLENYLILIPKEILYYLEKSELESDEYFKTYDEKGTDSGSMSSGMVSNGKRKMNKFNSSKYKKNGTDEEKFEKTFLNKPIVDEIFTAFYFSNFRKFEENIYFFQEEVKKRILI